MAVFWIQPYFTLPVIYEDLGMGDELQGRQQITHTRDQQTVQDSQAEYQHTSSLPSFVQQQPAMDVQRVQQQPFGLQNYPTAGAFDMTSISNTLHDFQPRDYNQPVYQQQFMSPSHLSQTYSMNPQQNLHFPNQPASQYQVQFSPQYNQYSHQHYRPPSNPIPAFQQGYAPTPQLYAHNFGMPTPNPAQAGQNISNRFYQPNISSQPAAFGFQATGGYGAPIRFGGNLAPMGTLSVPQPSYQSLSRHSSDSSLRLTVPRGPPRKPKQSGHALWVGNLPPGANILDLKDHFSRDASEDVESVFLISKSNCAFVNYRSEESCTAAMSRFHDSRFHGVRLVCRLRRGSSSASTAAASPGAQDRTLPTETGPGNSNLLVDPATEEIGQPQQTSSAEEAEQSAPIERLPERFFIVKSLTVEDLELSAQNGIWATQAHNENSLNRAYQDAENVYLIFSANKSGEYFGYARMESTVGGETIASVDIPARTESSPAAPGELPVTIPTPATATAPRGRIIDDSARGTIFWEAETSGTAADEEAGYTSGEAEISGDTIAANSQTFGKPFRITWLSTDRLPFHRTRGLRNPWNSNREVKIARDGTELEPSVGRRLVAMFHRPTVYSQSPGSNRSQAQFPRYPIPQQPQFQ